MKSILYTIALIMGTMFLLFGFISSSHAGGPWADQYCDITHETVIRNSLEIDIITYLY